VSILPIPRLRADRPEDFPPPSRALDEPNGLLAWGGDLSPRRLMAAYRQGIFPWYSEGEPLLWWSPDPRLVFDTGGIRLSSRFRRGLRRCSWEVRADTCFAQVIRACAQAPRPGQDGTWITPEMQAAYTELHRLGHAHSIEVFDGPRLVGGLYGVAVGRLFCAESMYSGESGASKVALAALGRVLAGWAWPWIDAQVENPHLRFLGGRTLPRQDFLARLPALVEAGGRPGPWTGAVGAIPAASLAQAPVA
jgi:leucyl/phenylalanyl-tRNA--protein transferase